MCSSSIKNNLTILVSSCDAYEDLWFPFFSLLKKYWAPTDIHIVFNTESKDFHLDGLDIECIHYDSKSNYGERFINALKYVKTKYVLLLLDDFFIRQPVCKNDIHQIIEWMDNDPQIAYFNCDPLPTYADYEINKYPGFKRLPPASNFTLNMQAAIWKTDVLRTFWKPDASPWEWETIYNLLILNYPQYKFYCALSSDDSFLDYGHYSYGDIWGVYRGKWVIEDVKPLFEKENIDVDFSIRGIYSGSNTVTNNKSAQDIIQRCKKFCQIRKFYELPLYIGYEVYRLVRKLFHKPTENNYFTYLLNKERKRFMASRGQSIDSD